MSPHIASRDPGVTHTHTHCEKGVGWKVEIDISMNTLLHTARAFPFVDSRAGDDDYGVHCSSKSWQYTFIVIVIIIISVNVNVTLTGSRQPGVGYVCHCSCPPCSRSRRFLDAVVYALLLCGSFGENVAKKYCLVGKTAKWYKCYSGTIGTVEHQTPRSLRMAP